MPSLKQLPKYRPNSISLSIIVIPLGFDPR